MEDGGIQSDNVSGWPVPAVKTVIDTPGGGTVLMDICINKSQ